jgi:magnesium-protoporphyrin O-methyltransferase
MTNIQQVQSYFNGAGFDRLRSIYCEEQCRGFRGMVRRGHRQVVETVLSWTGTQHGLEGHTILDAGCGIGTISIPLAQAGAQVDAIDVSTKMIETAKQRASQANISLGSAHFDVADLQSVRTVYDTVLCIDVFARYSTASVIDMLAALSRLTRSRMIVSFTPKTLMDALWLRIGNSVARRTNASPLYTHSAKVVIETLKSLGWSIHGRTFVSAGLRSYYCCVIEVRRTHCNIGAGDDFPGFEVWF